MFGKWLSISICSGPVVLKEGGREGGSAGATNDHRNQTYDAV